MLVRHDTKMNSLVNVLLLITFLFSTLAYADLPYFTVSRVLSAAHHDAGAFTEGLALDEDTLYESTGLWGHGAITARPLPPPLSYLPDVLDDVDIDGKVKESAPSSVPLSLPGTSEVNDRVRVQKLAPHLFGEGIAVWDNILFQLTYREGVALMYDKHDLRSSQARHYPPPYLNPNHASTTDAYPGVRPDSLLPGAHQTPPSLQEKLHGDGSNPSQPPPIKGFDPSQPHSPSSGDHFRLQQAQLATMMNNNLQQVQEQIRLLQQRIQDQRHQLEVANARPLPSGGNDARSKAVEDIERIRREKLEEELRVTQEQYDAALKMQQQGIQDLIRLTGQSPSSPSSSPSPPSPPPHPPSSSPSSPDLAAIGAIPSSNGVRTHLPLAALKNQLSASSLPGYGFPDRGGARTGNGRSGRGSRSSPMSGFLGPQPPPNRLSLLSQSQQLEMQAALNQAKKSRLGNAPSSLSLPSPSFARGVAHADPRAVRLPSEDKAAHAQFLALTSLPKQSSTVMTLDLPSIPTYPSTQDSSFIELASSTKHSTSSSHTQHQSMQASSSSSSSSTTSPMVPHVREGWGLASGLAPPLVYALHSRHHDIPIQRLQSLWMDESPAHSPSRQADPNSPEVLEALKSSYLYASDGTATLTVIDPERFATVSQLPVRLPNGKPLAGLNELEYVLLPTQHKYTPSTSSSSPTAPSSSSSAPSPPLDVGNPHIVADGVKGEIWGVLVQTDCIVRVHPITGIVQGFIWAGGLIDSKHRAVHVLNGIAFDAAKAAKTKEKTGQLGAPKVHLTGKLWPYIFGMTPVSVSSLNQHLLASSLNADGNFDASLPDTVPFPSFIAPSSSSSSFMQSLTPIPSLENYDPTKGSPPPSSSPSPSSSPTSSSQSSQDTWSVSGLRDWQSYHLAAARLRALGASAASTVASNPQALEAFYTDASSSFYDDQGIPSICMKHGGDASDVHYQQRLMKDGPAVARDFS